MINEPNIGEDTEEGGLGLILRHNPIVILVIMKNIMTALWSLLINSVLEHRIAFLLIRDVPTVTYNTTHYY
jgi:hypothetical protein